jgi:carbamoyl-phosphate synthase small subunit
MPEYKKIKLVLQDGTVFEGKSFGHWGSAAGDLVFNAAMTGYTEYLTDPAHQGQIVVCTYPAIGNYGVPGFETENGILKYHESDKVRVAGLVVLDYSADYSHWNAKQSLGQWLADNKVPAIFDVDTRAITKLITEKGSMPAKIVTDNSPVDFTNNDSTNLVAAVSTKTKKIFGEGKNNIAVVDAGVQNSILRSLLKLDCSVTVVPWDYDFSGDKFDGVIVAGGPGNPSLCLPTIENIKKALAGNTPIYGIGIGHLLLGLAAGGSVFKLKYGHHGSGVSVKKENSTECIITSQNHDYVLDTKQLNPGWEATYFNLDDNTNEGIRHQSKPFFSTQFYPKEVKDAETKSFLVDFVRSVESHRK